MGIPKTRTIVHKFLFVVLFTLLAVKPGVLHAQSMELGIKGGGGSYGYSDDKTSGPRGFVGFEACLYCEHPRAVFGEITHQFAPDQTKTGYRSAELFAAGLRLQGRKQVRPFLDLGFAVGYGRYAGDRNLTTAGGVVGFGVSIPAGQHLYVRPQFRVYLMNQSYFAASGGAGIGWRF